jgi:nitronate monooxygenase
MYASSLSRLRKPKCDKGYVLMKDAEGKYTVCPAKQDNENYFCICNGLLSSGGYNSDKEEALYTVGSNASRIDKIISVKTLMDELTGSGGYRGN